MTGRISGLIEFRRYSSYYQRTYNEVGNSSIEPDIRVGAVTLNSKFWRSFVLPFGSIVLICFWLTSCGGGSSHSPSSVSTAVHVSPSTATVATSATQQFTATVTGVSNTAVNWSVNGTAGGNSTVGTISASGVYTAPSSIPTPATVTVMAADQASPSLTGTATVTVINPPNNQQAQSFPIKLGTTGGNVNDITTFACCSGTLGSLVSRGGAQFTFILSNNHVLARSNKAQKGEQISQPGLVDNNCNQGNTVAHLTQFADLKTSGVDAALAAVVSGAVDSSGSILDLGTNPGDAAPPAGTLATAAVGMPVAKSGRSSGLTCSSVQSINTAVLIQYQTKCCPPSQPTCDGGTTFTVTFNNQVVVGGSTFSKAGDSGSLIVDSQTAQPVALLYGGSNMNTVGNPIQAVLAALPDPSSGAVPAVVGGAQHSVACPASSAAAQTNAVMLSEQEVQRATAVKMRHEISLMSDPAVIGVGVGASDDNPGEAALVLYVDREKPHAPIPVQIEGVRTKIIVTDRFQATSNQQTADVTTPEEALSDVEVARATAAKEKHANRLMSGPAILGVGIGRSADDRSQAALVIYVDKDVASRPIPTQIDGVRTKVIRTDRFRAYGWGKKSEERPLCSRGPKAER